MEISDYQQAPFRCSFPVNSQKWFYFTQLLLNYNCHYSRQTKVQTQTCFPKDTIPVPVLLFFLFFFFNDAVSNSKKHWHTCETQSIIADVALLSISMKRAKIICRVSNSACSVLHTCSQPT